MPKSYRLSTLRDVFERVPADRIELCMAEIAQSMLQAHAVLAFASDCGVKAEWPGECEWIDDGAGVIGVTIVDKDDATVLEVRRTKETQQ